MCFSLLSVWRRGGVCGGSMISEAVAPVIHSYHLLSIATILERLDFTGKCMCESLSATHEVMHYKFSIYSRVNASLTPAAYGIAAAAARSVLSRADFCR